MAPTLLSDFKTFRFWRRFTVHSFSAVGVCVTLLEGGKWIWSELRPNGTLVAISMAVIAISYGFARAWPRPIEASYSAPNTQISIIRGDILEQDTHLVIGLSDTFDTTRTDDIIASDSLQWKATEKFFGGDAMRLDGELTKAFVRDHINPTGSTVQKLGKRDKYGLGTVASVQQSSRYLFLLAYSEMDPANNAHSSIDGIWTSLNGLWEAVTIKGNQGIVSIPVIGQGHARVSQYLPAQDAIRLIILSFMFASRRGLVCKELRIVLQDRVYDKLDRLEIQAFLSSLRPS